MASKAQEVYEEIQRRIASGTERAEAFKELAKETGRSADSLRGSFYGWKRKLDGGENPGRSPRTRRRQTSPEDALADARAALERAVESIDREVRIAQERAEVSASEYEEIRDSAEERKQAITARLEALR